MSIFYVNNEKDVEGSKSKLLCEICGKPIPNDRLLKHKTTCCRSCATSLANIKSWQNPKRKEQASKRSTQMWANDFMRQKIITNMHTAWSSEGLRQTHSVKLTKSYENKELRQLLSDKSKASHKNPEIENRRITNIKKALAKPEEKQRRSKASSKSKQNFWNNLIAEEYKTVCSNMSKGKERAYNALSEQEKLQRHNVHSVAVSSDLLKMYKERNDEIQEKRTKTMRRNGTFNTSSWQKETKQALFTVFGEDDVIEEYRNVETYPFKCDFYIKSLDLYIECHYCQYHNYRPFDPSNEEHLKEIELLKEKSMRLHEQSNARKENQYDKTIKVWTDLDVRKQRYAIDNKLNWLAFYSKNDFYNWLNKGDTQCQYFT